MPAEFVETLPAIWYSDPEIHEAERQRIFARHWYLIANSGRLALPGIPCLELVEICAHLRARPASACGACSA